MKPHISLLAACCCSLSLAGGVHLMRVAHLRNRGTIWTRGMLTKVTHVMATGRDCARQ